MKEIAILGRIFVTVLALFAIQCFAQPQGVPANGVSSPAESDYAITKVGPDSVVWRNSAGQTVTSIATGMNYSTDGGQTWLPSDNSFTISADGSSFVADKLRDPTTLAANINQQGAVSAITPEGATMSSSPTAIVLYDSASGLSAIVGTITNSIGVQVDAQHVVYTNAFSSSLFSASIVYSLPDPGSFHQDVIFTGFNPNFDPTAYGFAADATNTLQIELLTEFFNAPQPMAQERDVYIEQDPNVRASMASPDFIDYTLDFGHYVFGPGRAYTTSSLPGAGVGAVVVKDFVNTNGRSFLVESLKYQSVAPYLQSLPPAKTTAALTPLPHARKRMMAWEGIPSLKGKGQKAKAMKVAGLTPRGVDVDYIATVSSTVEPKLYTSDTTYFVTNTVYLSAPVTIESAVFKFPTNQGAIEIASTLTLATTNYRTAIFTSADDSSAGATLGTGVWAGYTGTVTNHLYGKAGLWLATTANVTLNNLRFCFLTTALELDSDGFQQTFSIWNVQMVDCTENIYLNGANVTNSAANLFLYNCLMANSGTTFQMAQINVTNGVAYNCTVDNNTNLMSVDIYSTGGLKFTNSIISSLGSKGTLHSQTLGGANNVFYNSTGATFGTFNTLSSSPYVTNGAGCYYITNYTSNLTNGSSSVPASLLSQLKVKTTQAPYFVTSIPFSTILTPVIPRDLSGVALGWHYDSIDFIISDLQILPNTTLIISNGVALAYIGKHGITAEDGSTLYSQGTPNQRNYLAYYNLVQEQPVSLAVFSLSQTTPILLDPINTAPSVTLRLTTICAPTGATSLLNTGPSLTFASLIMRDCEVYGSGGIWQMTDTNSNPAPIMQLINNVFYRVPFAITNAATNIVLNNLFYGTTNTNEFAVSIQHLTAPSPNTNQNNVYDGVSVALDGSTVGYNAYLHGAVATLGGAGTDLTTDVTWVAGPLGNFYQPSGNALLNSGSESAANLGLYHYTVLTSEAIEGSSTVSRGYHYVALGSGGAPLDNNGDGYPDYLADANGDGTNNDSEAWTGNTAAWIAVQPLNQCAPPGAAATFSALAYGTPTVTYQWYSNSVSLSGATSSSYTISSVTGSDVATYYVVAANAYGSATSGSATLTIVSPQISAYNPQTNVEYWFQQAYDSLSVTLLNPAYPSLTPSYYSQYLNTLLLYPNNYQWFSNGTIVASGSVYGNPASYVATGDSQTYSVVVTNQGGSTNIAWTNIIQANPGMVEAWGSDASGECNRPASLTNAAAIAAGDYQSVAASDTGSVTQWGQYSDGVNYYSVTDTVHASQPPANGVVSVAAGRGHALALTSSNTVIAWGLNTSPASTIPSNRILTNIAAIACGYDFSLVLSNNGTVFAWGNNTYGQTNIPITINNIQAISASGTHALALNSNGTVFYWGSSLGITNPASVFVGTNTNVVAIASGTNHDVALFGNGTVISWGLNNFAQTNVPPGLSNVIAIAAGDNHSAALLNNGTVATWGDDTKGQTNIPQSNPTNPVNVKLLAAGGNHTITGIWSSWVQYPVNVAKDLLLITNNGSIDSYNVCQYYLSHRPMVSSANVLGINVTTNEVILQTDFTTNFALQVTNWLNAHPTKRPEYVILFPDLPSRVNSWTNGGGTVYPCVQYQLNTSCAQNWHPFVSSINMNGAGGVNDCYAYISKLAYFGATYSPGKLNISAPATGYGNTNYYFDDTRNASFGNAPANGYNARLGVQSANPSASITYTDAPVDAGPIDHITNGINLAGYLSWGGHSTLSSNYATSGVITWAGTNNGWWIIRTVESYNGLRVSAFGLETFLDWYANNAFGGSNYTNTPIGAVSYVDEPFSGATIDAIYFGLWESGKNFSNCAWNSINTNENLYLQVVGDPFVIK